MNFTLLGPAAFDAGNGVGFSAGAGVLSKNEKSADAHGSDTIDVAVRTAGAGLLKVSTGAVNRSTLDV